MLNMPKLKDAFENGYIELPYDDDTWAITAPADDSRRRQGTRTTSTRSGLTATSATVTAPLPRPCLLRQTSTGPIGAGTVGTDEDKTNRLAAFANALSGAANFGNLSRFLRM